MYSIASFLLVAVQNKYELKKKVKINRFSAIKLN